MKIKWLKMYKRQINRKDYYWWWRLISEEYGWKSGKLINEWNKEKVSVKSKYFSGYI